MIELFIGIAYVAIGLITARFYVQKKLKDLPNLKNEVWSNAYWDTNFAAFFITIFWPVPMIFWTVRWLMWR